MHQSLHEYLEFCGLFRGGVFFADMKAVPAAAYWIAVFLTISLTILVGVVLADADNKSSAGRAVQLYLATAVVSAVLFGIEVPFLVLLLSFGFMALAKRNS